MSLTRTVRSRSALPKPPPEALCARVVDSRPSVSLLTPVTVTVCGSFQLLAVKVSVAGLAVAIVVSSLVMVTVTAASGSAVSATV